MSQPARRPGYRLARRNPQRPERGVPIAGDGRTKVIYETRQLDDVNACFEEVLSGRVPARLVFDLTA